ncbi:quinon protein alcohol dehydrogenase-like superfamily [Kockovaella imperatae]|uniref:Quinon protein alcohol dehydrogenase-like superfamily n=1 Tax=Kockovaella imperatae TaxID=4999 RepID=A0A1Y1UU15_9TREE|nr:quinon protein alcohol dehydrogenase-like superfamily [Kockovaella imperatae]ORX40916.1 quinon protein alcohol dehydrogenase-like superfamily [Kockovaella imperatae]
MSPIPPAAPVQLHRARFLDYTPSPITCISFAPLPLPAPDLVGKGKGRQDAFSPDELGLLVVARENGNVEIWEWMREEGGNGNWVLERVLPPTLTHPTVSLMALTIRPSFKSYAVPKLKALRLFTAGSEASELVERCLQTGRILQSYHIPSPPIWSLSVSPTHTLLCLSTTAPTLTFISLDDTLSPPPPHLLRTEYLPSTTRTVSIAWGPPEPIQEDSEWVWRDTYLVTGNSDSSFRKWDIPRGAGRVTIRGRSVVEKAKKGRKTIIWGVAALPDGTIVTSDSLGSVTFWDGSSLAQKNSFKAHKADAMCLVVGPDGKSVFTSGPDQRVCQFVHTDAWRLVANRRIHSHDVRALAMFPPYTPYVSPPFCPILASGGWDMSLALTPAGETGRNPLGKAKGMSRTIFEESFARKLSYMGGGRGTGRISLARAPRLLLARKDRSVGVWKILEDELGWEKLFEMDFRLRTSLIASAISPDGRWVAVSDLYETKLFSLDAKPQRMPLHLVDSPELSHLSLETTGTGSSALLFTPDSQRLVLGLSSQVVVVDIDAARVLKCFKRDDPISGGRVIRSGDADTSNDPAITTLATSDDGQYLAVADLLSRVSIFNLDTLRQTAVLPTLPSIPLTLAFCPTHPSLLAIASPSGAMTFYNLDTNRFLSPTRQLNILNAALRDQYTPAQGISFEPCRSTPRAAKVVIWSHDWLCTARIDLEALSRQGKHDESLRKKRAREAREALESVSSSSAGPDDPNFFKISLDRFRGLGGVDWLAEGEMIVVERQLGDFMGELPPAFWSGGYGRA